MLKQRLRFNRNESYYYDILNVIKSNPGSCNEIWLSCTDPCGCITLDELRNRLAYLKPISDAFKKEGIKVSFELHILGAGTRENPHVNFSGLKNAKDYFSVDSENTKSYAQFCWNSKEFLGYSKNVVSEIAKILQPHCIYFDDDMRIRNYGKPVKCFCKNCIKKYNEINKTNYSFAEINNLFLNDIKFRKSYLDFIYEGITSFCFELAKAIKEASSETMVGLQHGSYGDKGFVKCLEAINKGSSDHVNSRSGGGGYSDIDPNELMVKYFENVYQLSQLPDCVLERCNEIESFPRNFYTKTTDGIALETSLALASGFNSTAFAMSIDGGESKDLIEEFLPVASKRTSYWNELVLLNKNCKLDGICIYVPNEICNKIVNSHSEVLFDPTNYGKWLYSLGLPITYNKLGKDQLIYLPSEFVECLSKEEVEQLLNCNVLTSGRAIEKLNENGYKQLINLNVYKVNNVLMYNEEYVKHPVNEGIKDKGWGSYLFEEPSHYFDDNCDNIEILSTYELRYTHNKELSISGKPASIILTTNTGKKWFVQGYRQEDRYVTYGKKKQIENVCEYLSEKANPTRIISYNRGYVIPMRDEKDKIVSVTVLNNTIAMQKDIEVFINNPKTNKPVLIDELGNKTFPDCRNVKNVIVVKVNYLEPWKVKTIELL